LRLLTFATAKVKGRIDIYLFLVLVAGLLLSLPVIIYGLPQNGHDSAIHILWYKEFSAQLWAGELYPRWLIDMNGGLGSPAFFYYPPVTYYLTSLLKPLFNWEIFGWRQLGWSATLALCASGVCTYAWLKRATSSRGAAFVGAVLYMAMPYHLAIDLYFRGALAEFWAFVWIPIILYFVHDVNNRRLVAFIGITIGYALLIGTHLPATLMFSVVPLSYAYAVAEKDRRASALALTVGAMALAVCLCAVYLLPALFMQRFVAIHEMLSDYRPHFLFTSLELFGLERIVPWAVWTTAGLAACAFLIVRFDVRQQARRINRLWAIVTAICLLLMLPLSNPVWWLLSPLQRLQFPWRFSMVLCVAASALVASAVASLKRPFNIRAKIIIPIAGLLVASWVPLTNQLMRNAYPMFNFIERQMAFTELRLNQRRDAPEYGPIWTRRFVEATFESLLQSVGRTSDGTLRVQITGGTGEAVIEHWQPRDIRLRVRSSEGVTLHVGQFYYAGWTGRLNDEANLLAVRPSHDNGILRIEVPRGEHRVWLRLERRWPEAAGQVVSLLSALLALIAAAYFSRRRGWRFGSLSSNTAWSIAPDKWWLRLAAIREILMNKMSLRGGRKQDNLIAGLIFIFSFFVFWLSPVGQAADSRYSMLLSQSLLEHQSFTLDHYQIPRFRGVEHFGYYRNGRIYQIEIFNNHLYYYFPPGTSILSVPYVALMNAVGISAANPDGTYNLAGEMAIMMSLAAILMAALSVLFYLTARLVLPRKWSLIVALGGAFGTQVWSTASRSLWNHTWMILLLGAVILMLFASETGKRRLNPYLLATLLSWMYFVRPTSSVCIVAISLYLLLYHREAFLRFALTGAAWLALFIAYSWYHFGQLLPNYYQAGRLNFNQGWVAFTGNLISPSRGTLVFVPVLLFIVYLLMRFRRELERRWRIVALSLAVIVMHLITIAGFTPWTGGECYGARYTTDLVPWFVLLAIIGLEAMLTAWGRNEQQAEYRRRNWRGLLAVGAVLLLLSVFINARGALSLETARWHNQPVSVDIFPERVWDWRRPQFLAGLQRNAPSSFPLIEGRIDVSQPAADAHLWYGWSGREERFRWTDGNEAAVIFALEETENVRLRLMLSPFLVPGQLTEQRVNLRLNGHALASFTLRESALREFQFDLPREMLRRENVLTFDLPDAASPAAYGLGSDTRGLAVAAYWLEIESPALREASGNNQLRTATNLPLPDAAFRAELSIIDAPPALTAGEQVTIRVRVRNTSGIIWPALGRSDNQFRVRLGNHWLDTDEITVINDDGRSPLPYDLAPGAEVEIPLTITAPAASGEYFLEVDMVQEGVSWFDSESSHAARVRVSIR
jgi:hypothetical protein